MWSVANLFVYYMIMEQHIYLMCGLYYIFSCNLLTSLWLSPSCWWAVPGTITRYRDEGFVGPLLNWVWTGRSCWWAVPGTITSYRGGTFSWRICRIGPIVLTTAAWRSLHKQLFLRCILLWHFLFDLFPTILMYSFRGSNITTPCSLNDLSSSWIISSDM